jgi:hypothetical protein
MDFQSILDTLKQHWRPAAIGLLVGVIFGLVWGWVIQPVEWVDADPSYLRADLREDYLRMAVDSYTVTRDDGLAVARFTALGPDAPTQLAKLMDNPGTLNVRALTAFWEVIEMQGLNQPGAIAPAAGAGSSAMSGLVLGLGLVVVLGVLGAAGYYLLRNRGTAIKSAAQQAAQRSREVEKTDYTTGEGDPPVAQFVTSYVKGDDLFDDSFSIDSPAGEFLGECGVGICETIGVGDPKKVTAFEVWVFDKNDIQTVTKVLMSEHAFNDPNLSNKLASKGELVVMEPGKDIVLETATLQMVVRVSEMQYGQGALPQNSFVENLTLELALWPKLAA